MRPEMNIRVPMVLVALMLVFACSVFKPNVPVECYRRVSIFGQGHVIIVKSRTSSTLSLWIKTEEKTANFTLEPYKNKEFGWLEGFHFGDNTSYSVGGEGYSPLGLSVEKTSRWD